jgi:hypothetical protein
MRKWTETVKPFPVLQSEHPYRVRVVDIRKNAKTKAIEVTLEFLESSQLGRLILILLTLPIRQVGLTGEYFSACHMSVKPEETIFPRDTINCEILVHFRKEANGNGWQPSHFKPIPQGENHVPIQSESKPTAYSKDL